MNETINIIKQSSTSTEPVINIVDEDETPKTSMLTKRSVTSVNSRQKKSKAISDKLN